MAAPSPAWQLVDLTGTWNNQDGTLKAGTYKVTVPVEITSQTDRVKIPAGVYATGALNTTSGSPSLAIQVPATDDPDNDPQPDWKLIVEITFDDKSTAEKYAIYAPYADRPEADGGTGAGVDLVDFVAATVVPQTNPAYKIGVPGGLAELNDAGLVVNADGSVPAGGSGTGTVTSVNGVEPSDGNVTLTKSDLDLDNVDNTADANKAVASAAKWTTGRTITLDGPVSGSAVVDGTADVTITTSLSGGTTGEVLLDAETQSDAWDALGTVPAGKMPASATRSTFTVASQTARLALAAQQGDIAIQTDTGVTYRLKTSDPTQNANWVALTASASPASTSTAGVVKLAVNTDTTSTDKAVTPAGLTTALAAAPVSTLQQIQIDAAAASNGRVMYGTGWPGSRPADYGKPIVWDDTALAISSGADTTGPDSGLLSEGDYWDTYRYEDLG
jgi:hypothetical protein